MKVTLIVEDIDAYSKLVSFITDSKGKIKLIQSIDENEISNSKPEQESYLDKLLRDYQFPRDTPSRVGDPYPGYEPIPYWLRPDYVGPRPGDVIYGVSTKPTHLYTDKNTTGDITNPNYLGHNINLCSTDSSKNGTEGITVTAKN